MASGSIGIPPDLYHHPPPHHSHGFEYFGRWPKQQQHSRHHRRPVEVMADVTNDLGVKILNRYIEQNGNVGFSPSGLGFVLVALYEGSAGSSSRQISDVLGLPSDRRITRIGLRDIHRRLRSYLNADAFLGGLTLNRDDINLRPEYEDVLRFYGFDISDDGNITTTAAVSLNGTTETLDASKIANTTDAMPTQVTTQPSTVEPTTINDMVEVIMNVVGDQSSTLNMKPTSVDPSTINISTAIDEMSQAAPVINAASQPMTTTAATTTINTNGPTVSSTITPMFTLTTVGTTSATTMASMMIMSIVQAIMNTMNGSSTTPPLQGIVGPPTVVSDIQTQSSDGSTTTLGASFEDSVIATSPMTTVVAMPIAPITTNMMMQRMISATTENSIDGQTESSDKSLVTVNNNNVSSAITGATTNLANATTNVTTPMTATTTNPANATTSLTTNPANSTTNPTTNPMAQATTNPTTEMTDSTTTPAMETTDSTTTSMMILMRTAPMDTSTDFTSVPTTPTITTLPTTPMTTMMIPSSTMPETMGDVVSVSETTMQMDNTMTTMAGDMMTNVVRKRRTVLQGPSGYFSSSADDSLWLDVFGRLNSNGHYQAQDEDILENPNPTTQLDFLVNGCDYSEVTAATYTADLPFAYFPSLRTSLLEFPLDDPRYKILVMLPSESTGTRRLARMLATESIRLRHLRRSLQPTWVTAVIPSFMLRGFVTLTPYLQRLGISDVFEPRVADLSPMSPDLGVYARDIQQSIGVNIRNNIKGGIGGADGGDGDRQQQTQPANLARGARGVVGLPPFLAAGGPISHRSLGKIHYSPYPGGPGPIPFVVDHPFLYFIVDDQTSVTLLAGRIDDPLNSRIMLGK